MCLHELIFHPHIEEDHTDIFRFMRKINFIKTAEFGTFPEVRDPVMTLVGVGWDHEHTFYCPNLDFLVLREFAYCNSHSSYKFIFFGFWSIWYQYITVPKSSLHDWMVCKSGHPNAYGLLSTTSTQNLQFLKNNAWFSWYPFSGLACPVPSLPHQGASVPAAARPGGTASGQQLSRLPPTGTGGALWVSI